MYEAERPLYAGLPGNSMRQHGFCRAWPAAVLQGKLHISLFFALFDKVYCHLLYSDV